MKCECIPVKPDAGFGRVADAVRLSR